MRLLVCGGRSYSNKDFVFSCLDGVRKKKGITCVIHGDATGADRLAKLWAQMNDVEDIPYPADWTMGRRAGPIRNERMLKESMPDGVIAFTGGAGTMNMVRLARSAGVKVWCPEEKKH